MACVGEIACPPSGLKRRSLQHLGEGRSKHHTSVFLLGGCFLFSSSLNGSSNFNGPEFSSQPNLPSLLE